MKARYFFALGIALILGAVLLNGCTTTGLFAASKAASVVSGKLDRRIEWQRERDDLISKIVNALEMQGTAEFSTGSIDKAIEMWMKALDMHDLAKPEFLIEKALKREHDETK